MTIRKLTIRLLAGLSILSLLGSCSTSTPSDAAIVNAAVASSDATTVTTLGQRPVAISLDANGLGVAKLGENATTVLLTITTMLGKPDLDSGWYDEQIGCDIGVKIRDVSWGALNLGFSSGPSVIEPRPNTEHLLSYSYFPQEGVRGNFATSRGLTVGDSVARLKEKYPEVDLSNSEFEGSVWVFLTPPIAINGTLSSLADDGVVTSIRSGDICID
jgi:hypothetical protein